MAATSCLARIRLFPVTRTVSVVPTLGGRLATILAEGVNVTLNQATIHSGFLECARRHPKRIALVGDGNVVTYGDLLAKASRLAAVIRKSAVPGSSRPIAIFGDKSVAAVEAIVAAVLAGHGYTFLNPRQRAKRLESMINQLRPSTIVDLGSNEWDHDPRGIAQGAPVIRLPETLPLDAIEPAITAACAYSFFTSGSTGQPKGVVVGHLAAWHAQQAFIADVGLRSGDVVCSEMGLGFDVSTIDIFATLTVGAALAVTPEAVVESPQALFQHLVDQRVSRLFTCPTAARMLLEAAPDAVQQLSKLNLCLTGELIPARLAELMRPLIAGGRVWNQYGATEFPFGLSRRLSIDDIATPNVINNPTAGSPVSVRQSDLGDVTLTGPGLFSGYVSPETDFAGPLPPVEAFMTGDRAEPRAKGVLQLLGRSDSQVRLGGHRIELREIECAAEKHPDVALAYVTYDATANIIVARVTAKGGSHERLDLPAIGKHLERVLPDYMQPGQLLQLVEAPRTLSGKKMFKDLADARIVQ